MIKKALKCTHTEKYENLLRKAKNNYEKLHYDSKKKRVGKIFFFFKSLAKNFCNKKKHKIKMKEDSKEVNLIHMHIIVKYYSHTHKHSKRKY